MYFETKRKTSLNFTHYYCNVQLQLTEETKPKETIISTNNNQCEAADIQAEYTIIKQITDY